MMTLKFTMEVEVEVEGEYIPAEKPLCFNAWHNTPLDTPPEPASFIVTNHDLCIPMAEEDFHAICLQEAEAQLARDLVDGPVDGERRL